MLLFLLFGIIPEFDIFQQAHKEGFYYRNVEIATQEICLPAQEHCTTLNGTHYLLKRKNSFSATITQRNTITEIKISPDEAYTAYVLFVRKTTGIVKIPFTKKTIMLDQNRDIISLQILGTGIHGPEVLFQRDFKKQESHTFRGSLLESINLLRAQHGAHQLDTAASYKQAAKSALHRIEKHGLVHYTSSGGSIRHTGIQAGTLGENLFIAPSEKNAWEMLINSPSHLYNILNPAYMHIFIEQQKINDMIYGVIIFGN